MGKRGNYLGRGGWPRQLVEIREKGQKKVVVMVQGKMLRIYRILFLFD